MTLLLASLLPNEIVITTDSRSTIKEKEKVTGTNDHFQKIFPIPNHPVVICQAGENDLNRQPLGEFLGSFMRTLNTGNLTILEISDRLRCYAHAAIRTKLEAIAPSVNGVNFWVAGFSYHESTPSLIEVFWQKQKTTLVTDENRSLPTAVVSGGDGAAQMDPVDWHKIVGKTTDQVRAYHRSLMDQAMHAPVAYNSVGGDIQEILVTPSRWQWLHPPQGL